MDTKQAYKPGPHFGDMVSPVALVVGRKPAITTKALQQFCGSDRRCWIEAPFRADGKIIATDGYLAVWIPDDGRRLLEPKKRVPNTTPLLKLWRHGKVKWPAVEDVVVSQTICGEDVAIRYVRLIADLGDVRYARPKDRVICFHCGEIKGAVMALGED